MWSKIEKKSYCSDDIVHFIDEGNIVIDVDFDYGITFYPETPTKIRQINPEQNYISRSCEKPQCNPSSDQHICCFDEQHSSIIFLSPYNLWHMAPAALMSLNHTNDTYSRSNQNPQPLTHQTGTDSKPVFFSFRTMDRKKGIARQLCILSKSLPTGWTSEQTIATVEEMSDL